MLVQFGNNWIQKIPLTGKLDSAYGLVQFWLSSEFFSSNYFQIGQACSPLTYTTLISFCFSMLMPIDKRAIKGKTLKKRLLFAYREDKTSLSSLTLHSSQFWHSRQAFAPPFLHESSTQHARKYYPGKARRVPKLTLEGLRLLEGLYGEFILWPLSSLEFDQ